uniref:Protochlorophyllide reductase n=1 Tax=Odontella aurita TaxID=265563 RepID=A0A7S4NF00_9STRA
MFCSPPTPNDVPVGETYIITGGTRGVGFGLARELLRRGQNVFLCGRSAGSVEKAISRLEEEIVGGENAGGGVGGGCVGGVPCDVSNPDEVRKLWDAAVARFGRVDVFVNNAGILPYVPLLPPPAAEKSIDDEAEDRIDHDEQISRCVDVNVKGAIYCCRVAAAGMRRQPKSSKTRPCRIYLMEGLGSRGDIRDSDMMVYGLTKYAGAYLANAVEKELACRAKRPSTSSLDEPAVCLGRLSPGIVTTDMLMGSFVNKSPEEVAQKKRILNILADSEGTVTPWLADQLIAGNLTIRWLTPAGILGRFAKSLFLPSRDLFTDNADGAVSTL